MLEFIAKNTISGEQRKGWIYMQFQRADADTNAGEWQLYLSLQQDGPIHKTKYGQKTGKNQAIDEIMRLTSISRPISCSGAVACTIQTDYKQFQKEYYL